MKNPNILWAQDREFIFLTINILNIEEQKINFNKNKLEIIGKNDVNEFHIELDLTCDINKDMCNWSINQRNMKINLKKSKNIFIGNLTKNKMNNIKVDWNRWIDEDTSEDDNEMMNNFNDFKKQLPEELLNKDLSNLPNDLLDKKDLLTQSNDSSDNELNDNELNDNELNDKEELDIEQFERNINLNIDEKKSDEKVDESFIENLDKINSNEISDNSNDTDDEDDGNEASCEMSNSIDLLNNESVKTEQIFVPKPITDLKTEELNGDILDEDEFDNAYWPDN